MRTTPTMGSRRPSNSSDAACCTRAKASGSVTDRHSNLAGPTHDRVCSGAHTHRPSNSAQPADPIASPRALSDWDLISIILVLYICVMLPLQLTFLRCAGVGLAVVDVLVDL